MKMFGYELKKFFSNRYILIFTAVFIVLDLGLAIYNTYSKDENIYVLKNDIYEEAIALYKSDKAAFDSEFKKLQMVHADYNEKKYQAETYGEEFDEKEYEAGLDRFTAFTTAFAHKYYIDGQQQNIKKYIAAAEKNISEYKATDIPQDSYLYRYQESIIEIYTEIADIELEFEPGKGWGDYFSFFLPNILIIVFLIIVIPNIVLVEENTGLNKIISSAKKGRLGLFRAKLFTCITVTSLSVLMFSIIPIAVIACTDGLSSAEGYIQSIEMFSVCPLAASIGKVFMHSICIKLLIYNSFSLLIMLISVVSGRYQFIFTFSFLICAVEYIIFKTDFLTPNNFFAVTNLFFSVDVPKAFSRYYGVKIFNFSISQFMVIVILCLLIFITAVIICAFIYAKVRNRKFLAKNKIYEQTLLKRIKNRVSSTSFPIPHNMFSYELYKMLIAKKMIFVIVIFILLKVFVSHEIYTFELSSTEKIYKNYMTTLAGELTEDKREYVIDEREYLIEIIDKQDFYQNQYKAGSIDHSEYSKYLAEFYTAKAKIKALQRVEKHIEYIDKKSAEGVKAYMIYDTGWNNMFFADFDYILVLLILMLVSGIFADEYRFGFVPILRLAKKGRRKYYRTKVSLCISLSLLFLIVFGAVDAHFLIKTNSFSLESAPIVSLEKFGGAVGSLAKMTISEFLMLAIVTRVIAFLILTLLTLSFSQLFKQLIAVLGTLSIAVFIPFLLIKFGFSKAGYFAFSGFLSGANCYALSADINLFGDFGLAVILLGVFVLSALVFSVLAYKRWNN